MAAESALPVNFPRRQTADPSRRQRLAQKSISSKERGRGGSDERQRSVTVSHTPSHQQEPPVRRRQKREKDREKEGGENISSPDNAESKHIEFEPDPHIW